MLLAKYKDRIEIEWGKPVRIVTGYPINKKYNGLEYDFYKEKDDGTCECRNLYSSMYGGYRIAFPDTPLGGWYGNTKAVEQEWGDTVKHCFTTELMNQTDKNKFVWCFPDFKYTIEKYPERLTRAIAMELLSIWQKHPEVELLIAGNYLNIAFNKGFWKLTEKKRKEICLFLRKNPYKNYCLKEVQIRLKYNLSAAEYDEYEDWNNWHYGAAVSYENYKYLKKQEEKNGLRPEANRWIKTRYSDYKNMLKSEYCIHNPKDDYWKYPKDLDVAHDRLNEEINQAIEIEREQQKAEQIKKNKNTLRRLQTVAKKYSKYDGNYDGFEIYVSGSIKDWNYQAKELHQCIVASNYYKGMANREYLIVFIRKDSLPVATCQIKKGKQIGQFYGNEMDRNNCLPSEEVKKAFNKYLEQIEIKESI